MWSFRFICDGRLAHTFQFIGWHKFPSPEFDLPRSYILDCQSSRVESHERLAVCYGLHDGDSVDENMSMAIYFFRIYFLIRAR